MADKPVPRSEWLPSPELADRIDAEVASFLSESTGEDATDGDDLRRLVCLIAGLACNERAEAAEAAERERHEALSLLASATDLLNTWARETGAVVQADRPEEIKGVIDRLWSALSTQLSALRDDKTRLDSGRIRLTLVEGCGAASAVCHTWVCVDLRAAIDAAKESSNA